MGIVKKMSRCFFSRFGPTFGPPKSHIFLGNGQIKEKQVSIWKVKKFKTFPGMFPTFSMFIVFKKLQVEVQLMVYFIYQAMLKKT